MLVYLWISAQILFVTLHFAIDCIADSSIVQQWANFLILTASSLSKLCFWMISHEKNLHFGDARAFQMDWLNDVLAAPILPSTPHLRMLSCSSLRGFVVLLLAQSRTNCCMCGPSVIRRTSMSQIT